ncbi:MAG TPA: SDR family oxidoreductase [Polyangiaceae bacterium]|jgi:NAD(P)-dependent dehydrogenase (short-subunit alcohol dehydrogenase family)|nr:SDR family oxidoreductase [Polyangiaceae bacterium]
MAGGLAGKVALIAGAGSGIGQAAATRLASEGVAALVLVGRRPEKLAETQNALGGVEVLVHPADIGDAPSVSELATRVAERYGRLDVLVNAAGINVRPRSLADGSIEDFQAVLDANLRGAFLLSRAFLPVMRAQGSGTIIHVVSDSGLRGNNFAGVAYIASKFGLRGLTEAINAEQRQHGIRAVAILPGEVNTPILDKRPVPPSQEERARMLQPEDVAECIAVAALLPARAIIEELVIRPAAQDWVSRR